MLKPSSSSSPPPPRLQPPPSSSSVRELNTSESPPAVVAKRPPLPAEPQLSYRDRVYIVKDIVLKLVEYGELTQTSLVSFCGLNLTKHKPLLDELEAKWIIERSERMSGKRAIVFYRATRRGIEFCRTILEPYEKMFPRGKGPKGDRQAKDRRNPRLA